MPRFLGIDHGTKRIGLAVSDAGGSLASPLATIEQRADPQAQARAVIARAKEYQVSAFVVGLPLNMDGSEGKQAKTARLFGEALARLSGRPVHYWDERLSSFQADELMGGTDLTHKQKKKHRDRIAAQVVLQEFLSARRDAS